MYLQERRHCGLSFLDDLTAPRIHEALTDQGHFEDVLLERSIRCWLFNRCAL